MMSQTFGAYAGFILSAYGFAAAVLLAMTLDSVLKARRARARLAELDQRGLRLRD